MTIGKWSDPISQRWIVPRQVILDDQPANEHPRSDHRAVVCYLEEISESRIDIYETKNASCRSVDSGDRLLVRRRRKPIKLRGRIAQRTWCDRGADRYRAISGSR